MIYFDWAATALRRPPCVAEAMVRALEELGNPGRGAHPAALAAGRAISLCRERAARLFGCSDPDRVAFAANATEALNMTISGLFAPGDHVIATAWEHNSALRPLYRLEERGLELSILPADGQGRLDWAGLEALLRPNTRGLVCTHGSNVTGDLNDVAAAGRFCRERGLLLVVDASQTAGVFPLDLEGMSISALCFTGHKSLMGPQGTGGVCLAPGVVPRPWKVGGSGIRSFDRRHPDRLPEALEAGTLNGHGLAGLSAALEWRERMGADAVRERETALARRFRQGVSQVEGVTLYGDGEAPLRAPIAALNLEGWDAGEVSDALSRDFDICTRPGAHCAPLIHQALGTAERGIVRFSFGWYNTEQEVDAGIAAIRALAEA